MNLLTMEMRRALRRRAVRVLVAIAVLGCIFAGAIAFSSSQGKTLADLGADGERHPAVMTDWWNAASGEGIMDIAIFFLVLGGFFGGATVAGGEWRAGTVTTLLTWEPRRLRLHTARSVSAAILAFVISVALQGMLLVSFLPAVYANGTAGGADRSFWIELGVVVTRTSLVTAAAAVLAVALATLGRNTAFAVITVFAWITVVEGLVRGLAPSLQSWLWGENLSTVVTWHQLDYVSFTRGPVTSLVTLLVYLSVIVVAAGWSFQRRDVAATT